MLSWYQVGPRFQENPRGWSTTSPGKYQFDLGLKSYMKTVLLRSTYTYTLEMRRPVRPYRERTSPRTVLYHRKHLTHDVVGCREVPELIVAAEIAHV